MGSPLVRALSGALEVLAKSAEPVAKTIWGSPAGKKRIANRLAKMLPEHSIYVEPFAGSAAVFFAKERVSTEVLNDADPEIARAFKILKRLGPKEIQRLRTMSWVGEQATYKKLVEAEPKDDVTWLHRFLYLSHFSYGKMRGKSFSPSSAGVEAKTVARIEEFAPRLKSVKVFSGDYKRVVEQFDGKDTVHFLDPPYAGYNVEVGEDRFDEATFVKVLEGLKGRFLVTYGIRGQLPKLVKEAGFEVRRIRTPRTIRSMRGVGGSSVLTQLLVSNYALTRKSLDGLREDGWECEDERPLAISVPSEFAPKSEAAQAGGAPEVFVKATRLVKGADPADERYVLGIVLEPEVVDAQGDIYSAEEIRQAAHKFMEEFGGLGLGAVVLVGKSRGFGTG